MTLVHNHQDRFLGPFWTDSNSNSDICQGNICPGDIYPYQEFLIYYWPNACPGDICPYQEYLSYYWPNFHRTLKVGSDIYMATKENNDSHEEKGG